MEEEFISVKKSNKKIIVFICILLAILLLGGGGYYYYKNYYHKDNKTTTEEKVKPRLQDDYYESANYEIFQRIHAAFNGVEETWNTLSLIQLDVDDKVKEITEEILADPNFKNAEMDNILALYNDYEGRNKRGFSELQKYFVMVDKSTNISEFNKVLLTIERDLNVSPFWQRSVTKDLDNQTKNVVVYDQALSDDGLPYEFFTEEKWTKLVDVDTKAREYIHKVLGYDSEKSKNIETELKKYYKLIQASSIVESKISDISSVFHKYTLDDIKKEIKNLPLVESINRQGLSSQKGFVIYDMGQLKAIDEYYKEENLSLFKEIIKGVILSEYFDKTTTEAEKKIVELNEKLEGQTVDSLRSEEIEKIRAPYIDDEVQKRYEAKYFTDEDKKLVSDYIEEIRKYYKELINNADWLSEATKAEAIKKLNAMEAVIGYQGKNNKSIDYVNFVTKEKGGSYIAYVILKNQKEYDNYTNRVNEIVNGSGTSTVTTNAEYVPSENKMYFFAGYEMVYEDVEDEYSLMGLLGFTIGHEMSHAFDNSGSKYDENGNVRDWWTNEDKEHYEKITNKIANYYSKYEFMGNKVDGEKTLGENIADLASMKAMVSIAEAKGATNDDYKKMFSAFAKLWAGEYTQDTANYYALLDPHTPGKVRVNGVLSSTDKFYEVYDVKEGDKMYIPKEERVSLW